MDPTPTPKGGDGDPDIYGAAYTEGFKEGSSWAQDLSWIEFRNTRSVDMRSDQEFAEQAIKLLERGILAKYREAFLAGLKAGFQDGRTIVERDAASPPPPPSPQSPPG